MFLLARPSDAGRQRASAARQTDRQTDGEEWRGARGNRLRKRSECGCSLLRVDIRPSLRLFFSRFPRVCVSHDDQRPRMSLTDAETQSHDHYSCCRRRSHFLDGTPGGEKGKEMVRRRSVGGERAKQPVLRVTRMQKGTRVCVC